MTEPDYKALYEEACDEISLLVAEIHNLKADLEALRFAMPDGTSV